MADSRWFNLIRTKRDSQSTKEAKLPINLAGTTPTIPDPIHKSTGLDESNPNGRTGNDWITPTAERFVNEADHERYQDIANSYLSEGPTPGRIPYAFNDRNNGRVNGATPVGAIGLLCNISGVAAGGLGDCSYIPHTSILRPAGKSVGSLRTIDDGAQVPGIFVADPTRR